MKPFRTKIVPSRPFPNRTTRTPRRKRKTMLLGRRARREQKEQRGRKLLGIPMLMRRRKGSRRKVPRRW